MNTNLDSTLLNIGTRRQFFFDDLMLEQVQDVTRRYYHAQKVSDRPLIESDQPWEHVTLFSTNAWNVIRDPEDGLFKCWYEDYAINSNPPRTWISPTDGKLCVDIHGSNWPSRMCYAQSTDGIHWEKPLLGIVKEDGRDTNIVLGGNQTGLVHCPYIFLDLQEPDRSKRYKVTFESRRVDGGNDMAGEGTFRCATSGDGIHWNIIDRDIIFGATGPVLGDVITVSRNPETGVYWANNRHPMMCSSSVFDRRKPFQHSWIPPTALHRVVQENRRRIFRSESVDFFQWSTPRPLIVPDCQWDNIDDSFYGLEQFQIGQDWVGLLNVFHMTENHLDVQLVYTRDGEHFQRVQPGRAWLPAGGEGAWNSVESTIGSKPFVVGDELFVYHGGACCHHDWWIVGRAEGLTVPEATDLSMVNYGMGLLKMKQDRFVSISSGCAREGLIVTPACACNGSRLIINALTRPHGAVRVALADGQDQVIQGFTHEDCIPCQGDHVAHHVRWEQQTQLPPNDFVKLHFYLKDADLFSFQFTE